MDLKTLPDNIVFYDGECGFCSSTVQFILNHKKSIFYFLPLQSKEAAAILDKYNTTINLDTIYYLRGNKLHNRSSAALQIARGLKGGYPLLFGFYLVPKFIRDLVYNIVAKNRFKIQAKSCMLPKPEDRPYFLAS